MNDRTDIIVFAEAALSYTTKKGELKDITPEGAMFSANKELAAQKLDLAALSAISKAHNGRFHAAVDIFEQTFAKPTKQLGDIARNKKFTFLALCEVIDGSVPKSEKGWTDKQLRARTIAKAILAEERRREEERTLRAMEKMLAQE